MKEDNELERTDIIIDRDMSVEDANVGQEITAYIETWFDVDKKFGTDTSSEDGKWLNLYGIYNPFEDTLRLEYTVSTDDDYESHEYEPTENEANLIKQMIAEKIYEEHGQSPQEFCEEAISENTNLTIGGIT